MQFFMSTKKINIFSVCGFFKYTSGTLPSLSILQHTIICLDRWLAIRRPLWYRTKTVKFGVLATLSAFVYQQALFLPVYIGDITSPANQSCTVPQILSTHRVVTRFFTDQLPISFILFSYPMLLLEIWRRKVARTKVNFKRTIKTQDEYTPMKKFVSSLDFVY